MIKNPLNINNKFEKKVLLKYPIFLGLNNVGSFYYGYGWLENEKKYQTTRKNILESNLKIEVRDIINSKQWLEEEPNHTIIFLSNIQYFFKKQMFELKAYLSKKHKKFIFIHSYYYGVEPTFSTKIKKDNKIKLNPEIQIWNIIKILKKILKLKKILTNKIKDKEKTPHQKLWKKIKPEIKKTDKVLELTPIKNHKFRELKKKLRKYENKIHFEHNKTKLKPDIVLLHSLLTTDSITKEDFQNIIEKYKDKKLLIYEKNSKSKDFIHWKMISQENIEKIIEKKLKIKKKKFAGGLKDEKRNILYVCTHIKNE